MNLVVVRREENLGWIEGRGGSWRGERTPPPCLHCTRELASSLPRLLICHNRGQTFSWDPQIRDYTGNRDSGTAPAAQVLDLVGRP